MEAVVEPAFEANGEVIEICLMDGSELGALFLEASIVLCLKDGFKQSLHEGVAIGLRHYAIFTPVVEADGKPLVVALAERGEDRTIELALFIAERVEECWLNLRRLDEGCFDDNFCFLS